MIALGRQIVSATAQPFLSMIQKIYQNHSYIYTYYMYLQEVVNSLFLTTKILTTINNNITTQIIRAIRKDFA